jgi:putative transposase
MKRISAPEQTREQLRALIEGRLGTAPDRSSLVLLAARLILEEALEGEVSDRIGRERYERADGEAKGYRNGYRPGRMKTAEGTVEFAAPQVRDTPEPFVSEIRENLTGRTQALEDLAVELYARGLSTRDIEDAFTDESGRRLLSRAAVSEITERLWAEYEDFIKRDLSEYRIVYLYVDGIAERLRAGQPREAVIAAWGIGEDGRKVLLHLMAGSRRTPRRCGRSSRTCVRAGLATPCWWSPTGRRASSAPSKNASRARRVSAAWPTGCAIWR